MNKFIAAAALIAAQWQPAHGQTIIGSIPEEFRGDWCWQENTNGEEIFRSGACKLKAGALSIDRMTLDTGRLSCVFDSGTASASRSKLANCYSGLRLVYGGVRHARSKGSEGAPR